MSQPTIHGNEVKPELVLWRLFAQWWQYKKEDRQLRKDLLNQINDAFAWYVERDHSNTKDAPSITRKLGVIRVSGTDDDRTLSICVDGTLLISWTNIVSRRCVSRVVPERCSTEELCAIYTLMKKHSIIT